MKSSLVLLSKGILCPLKIHTVQGLIDPAQLGKTMTHEHLLWDQIVWWKGDPEELSLREFIHQPVSMEILGQIYYHPHLHLDNIQQFNVDLAISEAMYLKKAGGSSLVDVTSLGLGRDPQALLAIAGTATPEYHHGRRLLPIRFAPGGDEIPGQKVSTPNRSSMKSPMG